MGGTMYAMNVDIKQFMDCLALLIAIKVFIGFARACSSVYLSLYGIMPMTAHTGERGTSIFHKQALTLSVYLHRASTISNDGVLFETVVLNYQPKKWFCSLYLLSSLHYCHNPSCIGYYDTCIYIASQRAIFLCSSKCLYLFNSRKVLPSELTVGLDVRDMFIRGDYGSP